jgi:hypothetical protein
MPVRVGFRCQFCDSAPDPEYLDVPSARWLVWHGRGSLGPMPKWGLPS